MKNFVTVKMYQREALYKVLMPAFSARFKTHGETAMDKERKKIENCFKYNLKKLYSYYI